MKKPTNEQILTLIRKRHPDPEVMGVCEDLLSVYDCKDVTFDDVDYATYGDKALSRDVAKALIGAIREAC